MKIKGKYSESAPLYAILLSVAGVLAVVVFFVVLNLTGSSVPEIDIPAPPASSSADDTSAAEPAETKEKGYEADSELANEMMDAVTDLIFNNYTVLRLYYTKGLAHKDEPYGNDPEDGYFTVDDDTYTSLEQIEEIVDKTYSSKIAKQIKSDPLGYGAIYKTRDNGTLGIIKDFTPMEYTRSWENPKFEIEPVSDTECNISITIHEKSDDSEVPLSAVMKKTKTGWKLTSVIM